MSASEALLGDLPANITTTGLASISATVYGYVESSTDSDWFAIYLNAGVTYYALLQGPSIDGSLILRNSAGTGILTADKFGIGGSETLSYTPVSSGIYYFDAQASRLSSFKAGYYFLTVDSQAADDIDAQTNTSSRLTLNVARSGTLEQASDADWHAITLEAGHGYNFQLSGARADALLRVFDADGLELSAAAAGKLFFAAPESGTYFVEVAGQRQTDTGSYTLVASELPTITIADAAAWEGNSGSSALHFVVKMSTTSLYPVTVRVDTVDGTALAGVDYVPVHRTITIPAGSTSFALDVPLMPNTVFQAHRVVELQFGQATNAYGSGSAAGFINDDDTPSTLKLPADNFVGFQWYLHAIRADSAWAFATGQGVKVAVFDQGIDFSQPDLKPNLSTTLSRDTYTLATGGAPRTSGDNHGTWVAGVIGAAMDGKDLVGVAPKATLVSLYSPLAFSAQYPVEIANAFTYARSMDVLNDSWGFGNLLQSGTNWAFLDDAKSPTYAPAFAALKELARIGRDGLGTVVVQSAGNAYSYGDDTNLHNFQNSRYAITVAATDYFGEVSAYSTSGASVLVSAPGGAGGSAAYYQGMLTTDRSGAAGDNAGTYAWVNGTSFAAPVVSGVVALMLEANPRLGYRDVQQILAYTATQIDVGRGEWRTNGATDWNGGGLHFLGLDHAVGFGQVDALAALRLASSWDVRGNTPTTVPSTVANTKELKLDRSVNQAIPDNNLAGVYSSIEVTESMRVERVDVSIDILHPWVGDLSITLASPSGTVSFLLWRPAQGALSAYGSSQSDVHFTFDTVLDWGEDSRGTWTLHVVDWETKLSGTLQTWSLNLIGEAASSDNIYVYTNDYADAVKSNPARATLRDTGGRDILNASAMDGDQRIDLSGLTASKLNGNTLTLAAGTVIETAVGGDGRDTLIAHPTGSQLRGMRGDDILTGGSGTDKLEGGLGNDSIDGGAGIDTAVYLSRRADNPFTISGTSTTVRSNIEGTDILRNVERLQFSDVSLAFDMSDHGGQAAKLVGAIFGVSRLADTAFVGRWLGMLDSGTSYAATISAALNDAEFTRLTGGLHSNTAVVQTLYRNVVGFAPSAADQAYFVGLITSGAYTQSSLALLACDVDVNEAHVNLVGLAQTGLAFIPQG